MAKVAVAEVPGDDARLAAAFEVLAESPDGVARMRELVLSLAVRGQLVPQDVSEGPFLGVRGIGSSEGENAGGSGSSLPAKWQLCEFSQVFDLRLGKMLDKGKNRGDSHPYLRNTNVQWHRIGLDDLKEIRVEPSELDRVSLQTGDLVICEGGEPGRCAVWYGKDPIVFQKALHRARPLPGVHARFFALQMEHACRSGALEPFLTGATIRHLTGQSLHRWKVVVPPPAEQRRIVARVDELMAWIDQFEAARNEREAARIAARDACLATLCAATNPTEVAAAWSTLAARFDSLFTTPEEVESVRQAILELAVRGRLVAQDPNAEPAARILNSLGREPCSGDGEGQLLTELPSGWAECFIEDVFDVAGGIQKTPDRRPVAAHYPYLRVANVKRGELLLEDVSRYELTREELDQWRLLPGDLLVVEGNGSESEVGRCARWSGEIEDCVHQNHLIRVRPRIDGVEQFVLRFLNSPLGMQVMKRLAVTTSGLFNLSVGKIRKIRVPLPPLAEQRQIVARVDELTTICDQLESALASVQVSSKAVAASLVAS